eukprot:gene5493-7185_t
MAGVNVRCHVARENGIHTAELTLPFGSTFEDYLRMLCEVYEMDFDQFLYEDEEDYCTVSCQADVEQMMQWPHVYFWKWLRQESEDTVLIIHAAPTYQRRIISSHSLFVWLYFDLGPSLSIQVGDNNEQAGDFDAPLMRAMDEQSIEISPDDVQQFHLVGRGAAGSVFRAVHIPSQVIMAVKIIDFDASPEAQQRIITELDILHKCRSPHIITYYGTYFNESGIHICTEFMDGGSLDKHGVISEPVLAVITFSVLQGLEYLSKVKVMHRDVKPSNILVNHQGDVKLCDFGVSRELEQSVTKTFVGTNAYMAPERIQHQPYNERSETWSLGLTLHELATGSFPYADRNRSLSPIELIQIIVAQPAPELPSHFSQDFCDLVRQCLIKQPDLRPAARHLLIHPWITSIHDGHRSAFASWIRDVGSRLSSAHSAQA